MSGHPSQILIYDNIPSPSNQRGVTRIFRHLTDGFISYFGNNVTICTSQTRPYNPARRVPLIPLDFRGSHRLKIHRLNDKIADYTSRLVKPALIYIPYYGTLITNYPTAYTVLDMTHELFPDYFPPHIKFFREFIHEKKVCIERAALLIAISESTARDVLHFYPHIDANKIVVAHQGVDQFFFDAPSHTREGELPTTPYFLYVGQRTFYKNFLRLLIAFGQSRLSDTFDLVVISPAEKQFSVEEQEQIKKYGLEGHVKLVTAASEHFLRQSYANAVALIYPSEYEGFGLPIVEAMASGTVVATSNVSSMPEIGGEVAFYFDPKSIDSICKCLQTIADLPASQRLLRIQQGTARAYTFTWERCQETTINAIKRLL